MRLLKLYDGDYPWDVRVEKMLRTLVAAGHEVTLIARNRLGRPRSEVHKGVAFRRLPSLGCPGSILTFPACFDPIWVRATLAAARECPSEHVIVRDLSLAARGVWHAPRVGCPALADRAEPDPEAPRSNWQFDDVGGRDHLARRPRAAEARERWVLRHSPRVPVVSPESAERLERIDLGPCRWTLVGNTPNPSRLAQPTPHSPGLPVRLSERPLFIFTGILVGDRGLEVDIAGFARPRDEHLHPALLVDPARRRAMGERGRKAVAETYSWSRDAERLLAAVESP